MFITHVEIDSAGATDNAICIENMLHLNKSLIDMFYIHVQCTYEIMSAKRPKVSEMYTFNFYYHKVCP